MKKYYSIVLLAIIFATNAQTKANRFFYELTYKPNKDSIKTEKEMMVLDINKEKSIYQSYQTVANDSIFKVGVEEMRKTGDFSEMKSLSTTKEDGFPERIFKTYPINEINFSGKIVFDIYNYNEKPNFNWKISNEKEKIDNYETQKATTEYGGRIWTAWFTTDIPFQDGPYKFCGLPGLIVKIEDSEKNYSWVLKGNKTILEISDKLYINEIMKQVGQSKELTVKKEKFVELYSEYKKDPMGAMKQQMIASYGLPANSLDLRESDKRNKERLAKYNNSIEIITQKGNKD